MRNIELIDPDHQKLANPPKGGDAKPWVYRPDESRDHDCQVA